VQRRRPDPLELLLQNLKGSLLFDLLANDVARTYRLSTRRRSDRIADVRTENICILRIVTSNAK
jgi:hypothetical protein